MFEPFINKKGLTYMRRYRLMPSYPGDGSFFVFDIKDKCVTFKGTRQDTEDYYKKNKLFKEYL